MHIHEKIRFLRQQKGWSQEKMAEKLDMTSNGYAKIERGETEYIYVAVDVYCQCA